MSNDNNSKNEAGAKETTLDAAALLDGTEFDLQRLFDEVKEMAKDMGVAGAIMMANTQEYIDSKRTMRETNSISQVVAGMRSSRAKEKWTPMPPDVALANLFARYPPKNNKALEKNFTPAVVTEVRELFPKRNPQQAGFSVDTKGLIVLHISDLRDVHSAREMAALLTDAGCVFPPAKPAHEYISFIDSQEGEEYTKCIVTLVRNQRALDMVTGTGAGALVLENYPATTRTFSAHAVKQGKVLKLEGPLSQWVKKMHLLGIPMQQILWKVVECLRFYGIMARSVYLDDEGQVKKLLNVTSPDFSLRAEFFSIEDAVFAQNRFDMLLQKKQASLFENKSPNHSQFRAVFKLSPFQIKRIQESHKSRILIKIGEAGPMFREMVKELYGSDSKASVAQFIEDFFLTFFPFLQLGEVEPETHPDGNVNLRVGISVYYKNTDDDRKAMMQVYTGIVTRSDLHSEHRIDFTRKMGDPFNDLRCEVYNNGSRSRQYPEVGPKDDADKRSELDNRSWKSDPITYFQNQWKKGYATSPYESRLRRLAARREAGLSVPAPPIGSDVERLEDVSKADTQADKDRLRLRALEGDALLHANPVHPDFWRIVSPYTPPAERLEAIPNPFDAAIHWNDTLLQISPELIIPMEWAALKIEMEVDDLVRSFLLTFCAAGIDVWSPGPAYNMLPIKPSTVPPPIRTMAGKDLRDVWGEPYWSNNPALIFKALAELVQRGWIVQERFENGLRLTAGPRMRMGHCVYSYSEPQEYLVGDGMDLTDEDAIDFSARLVQLIQERGLIWVPPSRLRDQSVPPYLIFSRANQEDVLSNHLRSNLEFEQGHFGALMQHALNSKKITQLPSPKTGGIYLVTEKEKQRWLLTGMDEEDYEPTPWAEREENPLRAKPQVEELDVGEEPEAEEGDKMEESDTNVGKNRTLLRDQLVQLLLDHEIDENTISEIEKLADSLLPSPPTPDTVRQVVECVEASNEAHQRLAMMAGDVTVVDSIRSTLAILATDLHRAWIAERQLALMGGKTNVSEATKLKLAAVTMGWSFYAETQESLNMLAIRDELTPESRRTLATFAVDPALTRLATAPAAAALTNDVSSVVGTTEGAKSNAPASGEEGGGASQISQQPTPAGGTGEDRADPMQQSERTAPVAPTSETYVRSVLDQLGEIAALDGMSDEAKANIAIIADDIGQPESVETVLDTILIDPSLKDLMQYALATWSRKEDMPLPARQTLAKIAVDTHMFWSFRTQIIEATLDKSLPMMAYVLATKACNNKAFFQSLASRLQTLALRTDLTTEQREVMVGFATSKVITDGAASEPQPRVRQQKSGDAELEDLGGGGGKLGSRRKDARQNPLGKPPGADGGSGRK